MVTQPEIEGMLCLSAKREFSPALTLAQNLLERTEDAVQRMVILYTIVTCSVWLGLSEKAEAAVEALDPLVGHDATRVFIAMTQAAVDVEAGRATEALELINKNLEASFMNTDEYKDWLYDQLVLKGNALIRLARCAEALGVLEEATAVLPGGRYEADILVCRASCLIAMEDYENAFIAAEAAKNKGDIELAARGLLQMAECRMWQRRIPEALALYIELEKQLPKKYVDANRVQTGISRAVAFMEKRSPQINLF